MDGSNYQEKVTAGARDKYLATYMEKQKHKHRFKKSVIDGNGDHYKETNFEWVINTENTNIIRISGENKRIRKTSSDRKVVCTGVSISGINGESTRDGDGGVGGLKQDM